MALSGSVTTNEVYGRSVTLNWTATQDITNNKSKISWSLVGSGSATGTSYVMVSEIRVTINGSQRFYRDSSNHTNCFSGTVLCSGTYDITHSSDGTKSFSIKVEAGIYEHSINCTASKNFTLNTIPRASTITWGSGNSSTAGKTDGAIINISRSNSKYTDTLKYSFGGATGTIVSKTSATSVKWTIPMDLINKIPNATSGTGTITCDTYNGTTKMGSSTLKLTVTVPTDIKPTVEKPTVTVDNSANSVIAGWGIYVSGYSKAKIEANASGIYSSTIKSFKITGGYTATPTGSSLSYTGETLSSGEKTFTVASVDSRGRTSDTSTSDAITVYDYMPPSISSFNVSRTEEDGTKMKVFANWSYYPVGNRNSLNVSLKYKKKNETSWQTYSGSITANTDVILPISFYEASAYNFNLIIVDSVGQSSVRDALVPTSDVLLDFRAGGKGLGIGKVAETDSMEVGMEAKFMKQANFAEQVDFAKQTNFAGQVDFAEQVDFNNQTNFMEQADFYGNIYYGRKGADKEHIKLPVIQTGIVGVTATTAGVPAYTHVTFPLPYASPPIVLVTARTSAPGTKVLGVGASNATTTGVDIYVTRTDKTTTNVSWIALV